MIILRDSTAPKICLKNSQPKISLGNTTSSQQQQQQKKKTRGSVDLQNNHQKKTTFNLSLRITNHTKPFLQQKITRNLPNSFSKLTKHFLPSKQKYTTQHHHQSPLFLVSPKGSHVKRSWSTMTTTTLKLIERS